MSDDTEDLMLSCIRVLQTKSTTSTKIIADLLMLDIEKNKGRITGRCEELVNAIKEVHKCIKTQE
jgi:hypothetical protein